MRTTALGLLGLACALALWLVYVSLQTGPVPGCDGGDCGIVLASKWAKIFGVPVGAFGLAGYIALLLLGTRPFSSLQSSQRLAATTLVVLIPLAALWFVALQMFVLKAFCPWCCATHAIATLGAVFMALAWKRDLANAAAGQTRRGTAPRSRPANLAWTPALGLGVVALAAFTGLQSLSPEPPKARARAISLAPTPPSPSNPPTSATNPALATVPNPNPNPAPATTATATPTGAATATTNAPAAPRRVVLHEGHFSLDPLDLPVYGSPRAQHLMVMVSDYTCPHCRHAVKYLDEVREAFDGLKLGVLMLPSHHGGESLEIQRFMLATWRLDPGLWAELSHDLYLEKIALRPETLRTILTQRLGPARLDASLNANTAWIETLFNLSRQLHATNKVKAKSGSIPQFVVGTELLVGAPADAGELFALLDRGFGLVREKLPSLGITSQPIEVGKVFAGTSAMLQIPFTNTGLVSLQIGRAAMPNGSRIVRGLQTPVAPGQTSLVEIAVQVPREPGPFEQSITLFSNTRPPEHPLKVRGTVWKPLRITPSILDFGRVDAEIGSTQSVMRIELEEEAFLESVRSQNPGFVAELKPVTPGRVYDLLVATTPEIGVGDQRSALMVALRKPAPPGWPESFAFAARAVAERPVITLPQKFYLPAGKLATDRHQQALVRCYDGLAGFAVTGAFLDGGPPLVQPEVAPATRTNEAIVKFTLPAGWTPPAPPGETRLVIQTTHPKKPTLEIPFVFQPEK